MNFDTWKIKASDFELSLVGILDLNRGYFPTKGTRASASGSNDGSDNKNIIS